MKINGKFHLFSGPNSYRVHNIEKLMNALDNRPSNVPLITVANHISCMDEPLLWGKTVC